MQLLNFTIQVEISEIVNRDKSEAKYGQIVNNEFMGIGRWKKEDYIIEGQLEGD